MKMQILHTSTRIPIVLYSNGWVIGQELPDDLHEALPLLEVRHVRCRLSRELYPFSLGQPMQESFDAAILSFVVLPVE